MTQSLPGTLDEVSPVQWLLLSVAGCFALSCQAVLRRRDATIARDATVGPVEVVVTGQKWAGSGNRLASIVVGARFTGLTDENAARVIADAKALCTVTNTLGGVPAIRYEAITR